MKNSTLSIILIITILVSVVALSYVFLRDNLDGRYFLKELVTEKNGKVEQSYLTPEECFRKGGRSQQTENGQQCQNEEEKGGKVIGYLAEHVCCLPIGEERIGIIKKLIKDRFGAEIEFKVEVDHPAFVRGNLIDTNEIFLASKYNGKWQINLVSNTIDCDEASKFDYPKPLVPECFYTPPPKPIEQTCSVEEREEKDCSDEANFACAWLDSEKAECESAPCAKTILNSCLACQEPGIKFWTAGECPAPN